MGFRTDTVMLFHATRGAQGHDGGTPLPASIDNGADPYGAPLDWSDRDGLTFSRQSAQGGMDLYRIRYRLFRGNSHR